MNAIPVETPKFLLNLKAIGPSQVRAALNARPCAVSNVTLLFNSNL